MAGRPREFDREQALQQAMLAFWRRGYEGTSMSDLVAALGIASARIYAAFGSKEGLFREAVARYAAGDGGFADLALRQESDVAAAIERMLRDAVMLYTRHDAPQGCMVVSAATNCSEQNDGVQEWLRAQRQERTQSVMERLRRGVADGQLRPDADADALGDFYAAQLHGISVQARDGVPRERLLASVRVAMAPLWTAAVKA
ncbi:TetR family transcriptional regulator [Chromobacterium sp. Panama]|uniref:TetR/AcrR family transcriptional regulator n=1 Tax=Chromobacterium sp. Panama TaxID=2161826 RepID=UPI000D30C60F|nr:TetR/AcrR family transcriptional regulator [Chromobacterium sp. Panama]PTU64390.1 TetR family transcriptional regulator [Chromobacterium sp. Panama]